MVMSIAAAHRNSILDVIQAAIDAGAAPGYIEIRSGTRPANADSTATGTVLVTFTLADPGSTVSGDTLTVDADPDIDATAAATGTASWGRVYDSDGSAVFDGSAGTSGTEFVISSTSITAGQTVTLVTGTVTMPA